MYEANTNRVVRCGELVAIAATVTQAQQIAEALNGRPNYFCSGQQGHFYADDLDVVYKLTKMIDEHGCWSITKLDSGIQINHRG